MVNNTKQSKSHSVESCQTTPWPESIAEPQLLMKFIYKLDIYIFVVQTALDCHCDCVCVSLQRGCEQ